MNQHIEKLSILYKSVYKENPDQFDMLPQSGSSRIYYRLGHNGNSVVGAFNADVEENRAFIYLSNHFSAKNLNVPKVIAISPCETYYIQTDLGSVSLYDIIAVPNNNFTLEQILTNTIKQLVHFQVKGSEGLDPTKCFPIPKFDRNSVMWDLNYFKYCFLKPSSLTINEVKLEAEFNHLADILLAEDSNFFHYRDFQSRNILVKNSELFFIDFQGGRLGPCLYDIASFLYQAKAGFSNELREKLFNSYLDELEIHRSINRNHLKDVFPYMVLFRILQTLGAYGFRGFLEKKTHFIQSIPFAINNFLELSKTTNTKKFIYINELLQTYSSNFSKLNIADNSSDGLTVSITSFSFKKGYPDIHPEHGGGFVFDCRSLPNPGRIDKYKLLTGFDKEVAEYLNKIQEVAEFNKKALDMVSSAIDNYNQRNFKFLSVAFGCTGGQHRSVYCANLLSEKLSERFNVNIMVNHREILK